MQEESVKPLRIFVLADTHNRLPEKVKEIAKGADEIWHLRDVCAESILDELLFFLCHCYGGPVLALGRGTVDLFHLKQNLDE